MSGCLFFVFLRTSGSPILFCEGLRASEVTGYNKVDKSDGDKATSLIQNSQFNITSVDKSAGDKATSKETTV